MGSENDTAHKEVSQSPKRCQESQKAVTAQTTSGYSSYSVSLTVEEDPTLPSENCLADVNHLDNGMEMASEEDSVEDYSSTVNYPNAEPVSTGTAAAAISASIVPLISVQIFPRNYDGPAQETSPGHLLPQEMALISSPMTPAQPPWPISLYMKSLEGTEARNIVDTVKPFVGNYSPNESFQ